MHGTNENPRVEDSGKSSYDVRIAALETDVAVIRNSFATKDDITALRAEMYASHERIMTLTYEIRLDFQSAVGKYREESQTEKARHRDEFLERLAELQLEVNAEFAKFKQDIAKLKYGMRSASPRQRAELYVALGKLRYEFQIELAKVRYEVQAGLASLRLEMSKQREDFNHAFSIHREEFGAALSRHSEDMNAALAKHREDFNHALYETRMDLHRALMGHVWKLYGFASLLLGGVYYIARYVH